MSLNVDNSEMDLRLGKNALKLFPDTEIFTLGADPSGNRGAHFLLLEHYFVSRTMDLAEKLGSFHYFEQKISNVSRCLEFKPRSYIIRHPSGNLVQEIEGFRPILQSWPPSSGATIRSSRHRFVASSLHLRYASAKPSPLRAAELKRWATKLEKLLQHIIV